MNLALVILRNGVTLVSEMEELEYEPKVHLVCPYEVGGKTKVTLSRFPQHTEDEHILLRSEELLTVCEPTQAIVDKYLKKVGKTLEELKPEPKPVILTEDTILDDEEYEPRYTEE